MEEVLRHEEVRHMEERRLRCGRADEMCRSLMSASQYGVGDAPAQVPSMIWNGGIFLMSMKGG